MNDDAALYSVKAQLIERRCGGWLAITPRGWPLSIGVTAATKSEAKREFEVALDRWSKINIAQGKPMESEDAIESYLLSLNDGVTESAAKP